jgi:hypothetical protein
MTFKKPEKVCYSFLKQISLYSKTVSLLKLIFKSDQRIKEIRIYGSALKKKFGIYKETYKRGTPIARNKTDIDTVFLIEGIKSKKVRLQNGYILENDRFIQNSIGKNVEIECHPIMCAPLTTPEDYYANLNKPYPAGYNFTKDSKILFKRK